MFKSSGVWQPSVEGAPRARTPQGDGGSWQLSIDLSDILMYLYHHSVVSGIQRVIAEVLPHIEAAHDCQLVAFSERRAQFMVLDKELVVELLDHVRHARPEDTARTRELVVAVQHDLDNLPALNARPGDVLGLLGAAWVYDGLFQAVTELKAQGAAVVVLIYDLIPVVFPGFAEAMILQFRQYLPKVAALADRVPAISAHSRADFERYCRVRGLEFPGGVATGLAADQWSQERLDRLSVAATRAWDRPFVLLVSTVESRKNHILAFRCWQRLLAERGPDAVPDLVCVGRIGWNVFEFLSEFEETLGLGGKIHLLSDSLSDGHLTALYRDCLFTVYPSRYEGWGLPITESLAAGKAVVAARNTSLVEAGGDFVRYFEDDDLEGFHELVSGYLDHPDLLEADTSRILTEYRPLGWADVADTLLSEFQAARENRRPLVQQLEPGREYGLAALRDYQGGLEGIGYLNFIHAERRLPLTGQVMGVSRAVQADLATSGRSTTRTANGRLVRAGGHLSITFERPDYPDPVLVVALSDQPAPGTLRVRGPAGVSDFQLRAGEAVSVPLGGGEPGELVTVHLQAAGDPGAQEFTVASFVVAPTVAAAELLVNRHLLRQIDAARSELERLQGQSAELQRARAEMEAKLEQANAQLGQLVTSTSWKVTRPIRSAAEVLREARRK